MATNKFSALEKSVERLAELAMPTQRRGYLGIRVAGGQYNIADPTDAKYYFVRFDEEGTYTRALHRGVVAPVPDLPVRIEWSVQDNADVIAGISYEYISEFGGDYGGENFSVGQHTHERFSSMSFPIDLRLMLPFQIRPVSAMTIKIMAGFYVHNGEVKLFPETQVDLTSLKPVPGSDLHRLVIVGIDPDTATLVVVSGSTKATSIPMSDEDVVLVPFDWETNIAVGAIRLYSGQVGYSESDWYAIQFLARSAASGGAGTDVVEQDADGFITPIDVAATGYAFPHVTTAERDAIASPVQGAVIYNWDYEELQLRDSGTWVSLTGASTFYNIVANYGGDLTQRLKLNFFGAGVTVTDNAGTDSTDIEIAGGSGSGVGVDVLQWGLFL